MIFFDYLKTESNIYIVLELNSIFFNWK